LSDIYIFNKLTKAVPISFSFPGFELHNGTLKTQQKNENNWQSTQRKCCMLTCHYIISLFVLYHVLVME